VKRSFYISETLREVLGSENVEKFRNWEMHDYDFLHLVSRVVEVLLEASGRVVKEGDGSIEFYDSAERTPRSWSTSDFHVIHPRVNWKQLLWSGERVVEELIREEDDVYYRKSKIRFSKKTDDFTIEAIYHECLNCGYVLSHESYQVWFKDVKTKLIVLQTYYYQDLPSRYKKIELYRVEEKNNKITTTLLAYRAEIW